MRDAPPAGGIRTFGAFSLDTERGCLLVDGAEVSLRPKTFALLSYLAANPGRLVPKDELIRAVWRGAEVTDDVLVQGMGELRRALGEKGEGLIRTVPRRGYRFDAEVSQAPASSVASIPPEPGSGPALQPGPLPSPLPRRWLLPAAVLGLLAIVAFATAWRLVGWDGASGALGTQEARRAHKPALAVLPFANLGGSAENQLVADELTRTVIGALGRSSYLTVLSWGAVQPYRDAANPATVARSLDVQYQVEGDVRLSPDRIDVMAQLVNPKGRVLWSGTFSEPRAEVFTLQDNLIAQIAAVLNGRVAHFEIQSAALRRPGNLDAHDYLMRALHELQTNVMQGDAQAEAFARARELLKRATDLDKDYAAAWSARAALDLAYSFSGWEEFPVRRLDQAEAEAQRALALDESNVGAHVTLGHAYAFRLRYVPALQEMDRALEINPNDPAALAGRGQVLLWMGQARAAIQAMEGARRISRELAALDRVLLALAYYLDGHYDTAVALLEDPAAATAYAPRTEGAANGLALLAASHAQLGHTEQAAHYAELVGQSDPVFAAGIGGFGSKLRLEADRERLREGLAKAGLYLDGMSLPTAGEALPPGAGSP